VFRFSEKEDAVIFNLRVLPNASKTEIVGEFDGLLKIRIAAPPADGAANAELVKFLSKKLGVAKSAVEIIGGQSSRNKQVKIQNADSTVLSKLLQN
jgi:uncharacterized protein